MRDVTTFACFYCDRTTSDESLLRIAHPSGRLYCADCRDCEGD